MPYWSPPAPAPLRGPPLPFMESSYCMIPLRVVGRCGVCSHPVGCSAALPFPSRPGALLAARLACAALRLNLELFESSPSLASERACFTTWRACGSAPFELLALSEPFRHGSFLEGMRIHMSLSCLHLLAQTESAVGLHRIPVYQELCRPTDHRVAPWSLSAKRFCAIFSGRTFAPEWLSELVAEGFGALRAVCRAVQRGRSDSSFITVLESRLLVCVRQRRDESA